jgi:hypothetical protein
MHGKHFADRSAQSIASYGYMKPIQTSLNRSPTALACLDDLFDLPELSC